MKLLGLCAYVAALALVAGCASTEFGGSATATAATPPQEGQTSTVALTYQPASNADVRAYVDRSVPPGDPDFIPRDRNWLQLHLIVQNAGQRMVIVSDVKERLADGTTVSMMRSVGELVKPPSAAKMFATSAGITGAGMIAGMMIFPPLGLAAGLASSAAPFMATKRYSDMTNRIAKQGFHSEVLAPSTSTSGYVFVPAATNQTGILVIYTAGEINGSVYLPRKSS